jgi:hypothetical protein
MENCHCFQYENTLTAVSLAISSSLLAIVYSDNSLRVLSHNGTEKASMQLGQHFMKPPISLALHSGAPTVALGAHSSRAYIIEFGDAFNSSQTAVLASASNDGLQGIAFPENFLYCASRAPI